jgi:hypothetical protein
VITIANADPVPAQAGYAVPPHGEFVYRSVGQLSENHRDLAPRLVVVGQQGEQLVAMRRL